MDGVRLFSLQKGEEAVGVKATHFDLKDLRYTAAIINDLDLVVTVDTSVLHLTGAMGKPALGLIPYKNDWRWQPEGDRTEWYRSVQLIRQSSPGDWDGVFCRAAEEILHRKG
jgi:ADP-heptose:LPS heptosyltransferase